MASQVSFPITEIYFPNHHDEIEKIVSKKYLLDIHRFADLYIHFKSQTCMERFLASGFQIPNEGAFITKCYWTPDFFLRLTFFDQNRKETPHSCIDEAIRKIANTIAFKQQDHPEIKETL